MTANEIAEDLGQNIIIGIAGAASSRKTTLGRSLCRLLSPGAEVVEEVPRHVFEHGVPDGVSSLLLQHYFMAQQIHEEDLKAKVYPITISDAPALAIIAHAFRCGTHGMVEAKIFSDILKMAWHSIARYNILFVVAPSDFRADGLRDRAGTANSGAIYDILAGFGAVMGWENHNPPIIHLTGTYEEREGKALAAIRALAPRKENTSSATTEG